MIDKVETKSRAEKSIPELFEAQSAENPDLIALKSARIEITYHDLNRAANRAAHAILDRRAKGSEPIVVLMDKDVSVVAAILAILKAGKFYIVLQPQHPPERLSAILDDLDTRLIIADTASLPLAEQLSGGTRGILNLDTVERESEANLGLPISPEDLFGIFYTSGSTGLPKGVVDTHARLLRGVQLNQRRPGPASNDRPGHISSLGAGSGRVTLVRSLVSGAGLYLFDLERDGVGRLGDWLMEEEISSCTFMASLFRHLLNSLEARPDLAFPKMRQISLGGEPVFRRDVELYRKYFPDDCRLRASYGATEASGITSLTITKESEIASDVLPVGYPLEGNKIFLIGEDGKRLSAGEVGEIVVQSSNLSPGYWRRPELTAAVFQPAADGSNERIYHTGDLGRLGMDGLLYHLGRKDQQVKIRGNRVETAEVEMQLLDMAGVKEACVAARDGRDGNKDLVAYLVAEQESRPPVSEIRDALARKLPDYAIPSRYQFLETLPVLPDGKVDRRALPAPDLGRRKVDAVFVAPRDRSELELVQIWQELLGVQPIGVTENFFDLGGHSLLAARLLTEIEKKYARKFPPRVLLQASTVEQLAALLHEEGWEPAWSPLVTLREQGTKPPLFYIPPFNYVLGFYPLATYLPTDQPIYALLASPSGQEFPFSRLEDEAAFYVKQVKTVQPHGPYYLLGWSYGGVMAFEMAQQFFQQGERVAFLGVLDIGLPSKDLGSRLDFWMCRSRYFWRLGMRGMAKRLGGRMRRMYARQFDGAQRRPIPQAWEEAQARPDYPEIAKRVGFRGYVPKKYPGRVTLFQVQDTEPHLCRNVLNSWVKIAAGGVQTYDIPGVHNTMLLEPYVRDVAEKLQVSLAKAQS